ncbi:autophagy-related protein 9A-like [Schistocerca piceifrons]|uniref:autophagy-related protein 9A-like n=1 Tax=Schistocerca piceifrons TaxID=274613 RepID=UPI001F5FA569|nr:autophagy-related protein 9A-like [Schistocerca piceifrons]XP_047101235.1 autophagy-related protein 9A-like [Schistocerca piceifrons]XP_049944749.1 autophagy-related protein 9A [Schistocerca serialis cubense]XP_049944750.1 autophagy-related protein 9A [Schistocerca serialis cubense]
MTATLEASYQPLQPFGADPADTGDETPQESGVMIHVVPESGRARWNHVEDLDAFFTRMYHYHQKHGFACMMLQELLELGQFVFVAGFATFLLHCVDYPVLFRGKSNATKVSLPDAVVVGGECVAQVAPVTWLCLFVAGVFWLLRAVKVAYHLVQFWDIKAFFNSALRIPDSELDNLTWHEVQRRVREVQREQQMCIHKQDLSELDIYHRILRFKNYMVAMVNKSVLPLRWRVPFLGEIVFLTRGLKYNIELLLFWGPWAPFENSWHLREDYKKAARRQELARQLATHMLWVGVANFALMPVITLWQILYSVFNYTEMIKREPGSLGTRRWSLFGRLYLRHLNELEHELNARLNRAYRPASRYMGSFTSPLLTVVAKNVSFMTGAFLAVLLILTIYDEDVLTVEHVLTAITVFGGIIACCRSFIPDENLVFCPEKLMTAVLAHAHYLPDSWRGQAHTARVRDEFAQLFQYKAVYVLEELASPLVTPFVIIFLLRRHALDIVDFLRNFTVEVVGVGDVCSFAQMDVRRHGSPAWQAGAPDPDVGVTPARDPYAQAEDGKTELSLVHFTLTNPEWRPPTAGARGFVAALRERVLRDVGAAGGVARPGGAVPATVAPDAEGRVSPDTATAAALGLGPHRLPDPAYDYSESLGSISGLGLGLNSVVASALRHTLAKPDPLPSLVPTFGTLPSQHQLQRQQQLSTSSQQTSAMASSQPPAMRGGLNRAEGPLLHPDRGLLYSLNQQGLSMGASVFGPAGEAAAVAAAAAAVGGGGGGAAGPEDLLLLAPGAEGTAADMSLSALYLHEVHHRLVHQGGRLEAAVGVGGGGGGPASGTVGVGAGEGYQQSSAPDLWTTHSPRSVETTPLLDPGSRGHLHGHGPPS